MLGFSLTDGKHYDPARRLYERLPFAKGDVGVLGVKIFVSSTFGTSMPSAREGPPFNQPPPQSYPRRRAPQVPPYRRRPARWVTRVQTSRGGRRPFNSPLPKFSWLTNTILSDLPGTATLSHQLQARPRPESSKGRLLPTMWQLNVL